MTILLQVVAQLLSGIFINCVYNM